MIVEEWHDLPCGCSQSRIMESLGTVPRHYIILGTCEIHRGKIPIPLAPQWKHCPYGPFEGVLRAAVGGKLGGGRNPPAEGNGKEGFQ
jgi:hypothetical protein